MVTKFIDGQTVSLEWREDDERYRVYVSGKFVGSADTTKEAAILATDYIELLRTASKL